MPPKPEPPKPGSRPTAEVLTPRAPRRTCVGCRAMREQPALLRLARAHDGTVTIDRGAPGRGAWICADEPLRCLTGAVRRRSLPKAFRGSVDDASVAALAEAFGRSSHDVADLNAAGGTGGTIRKG